MGFAPSKTVADAEYLLLRAAAEAEAAEVAANAASAEAHHKLASIYLDRILGEQARLQAPARKAVTSTAAKKEIVAAAFRMLQPVTGGSDYSDLLTRLH